MIDIMLEPLMDFEWDSSQMIPQWNRNGPEVSRPMFCLEGTLSRLSVLKTRITCFSINIKMKMKEKVLFSSEKNEIFVTSAYPGCRVSVCMWAGGFVRAPGVCLLCLCSLSQDKEHVTISFNILPKLNNDTQ